MISLNGGLKLTIILYFQSTLNDPPYSSDEVIESIVSEGDINLLGGLLHDKGSDTQTSHLLHRKILPLDQFYFNVVGFDVMEKQMEKVRWLHKTSDSISSLLDDILITNQFDETKSIVVDCY